MNDAFARPSQGHDYYKKRVTWRSFEAVLAHTNALISGRGDVIWWRYLKDRYGAFDTALFFNCGNGWVERGLFRAGVIKRAIGFDISPDSLRVATEEAAKLGMPAQYQRIDVNHFVADAACCDLVINNGAGHHVAYINRLTKQLHRSLKPDGIYVMMDYTGPHRNQYPWAIWSSVVEFNQTVPPKFRRSLRYAHMKTMLHLDPTEAVHSELQLDVLSRYFNIVEQTGIGGGIAYSFLHNHNELYDQRKTPEGAAIVRRTIEADREFLSSMPESNMFTFCVAKPLPAALENPLVDTWAAEEAAREEAAQANGGRYYPPTALELIYNEMAAVDYKLRVLRPSAAGNANTRGGIAGKIVNMSRVEPAPLTS